MEDFTVPTRHPAAYPLPLVPRSRPGRPSADRPGTRPLPDPVAVKSVAVPDSAPPYDDLLAGPCDPHGRVRPARPSAAARRTRDMLPTPADRAAALPPRMPAADHGTFTWPSRFAQVLAETLAGSRPPRQIAAWTTEQARKRIGQLGPMMADAVRPHVRRVIITSPAAGVVEMTVIVGIGPRVRALAIRLERLEEPQRRGSTASPGWEGSRWLCTAVEAA